ncbi:UNVERIFIED_ORG: hypothetical protein BDU10_7011 [Burkholderia sp. CF145]
MSSENQAALNYLEHIQRNTYIALGIQPLWMLDGHADFVEKFAAQFYESSDVKNSMTLEEFRKGTRDSLFGSLSSPISSYQDPAFYFLLSHMTSEIEGILDEQKVEIYPRPIFGSLPTGRVNGVALRVPDSDQLIVLLEDGLFGFANLTAKAVSRVFPLKGEGDGRLTFSVGESDWKKEFAARPDVVERFVELLLAYLIGGHPHAARPYLPEPKYEGITSLLRDSMELFVLSHEYGHCISGHLDMGQTKKAMLGGEETDEVLTSWNQEIEADVAGLGIMLAVMRKRGFDLSLSFWGVDFFFGCIEIVERAVSILRTGRAEVPISSTHPPTELRREMMHRVLKNSVPEEHAAGPLQLAGIVASILNEFWLACEPVLQKVYEDRTELAPAWRQ